jgi:rRNA biogenesis protein RRP5
VKKRLKGDKERAIREAEQKRLAGAAAPTNASEFEALALASPGSSFVWIRYMAFLISLGELEAARGVAERALRTIPYRDDAEKFNVWVAWLNAENLYGSEDGTLQLLHRALAHTDARRMYLAAVDVFDRTDKAPLAEQCLKAMCRKFSAAPDVWLRAVRYYISRGDADAAKRTLDRSLQSLPRADHVGMASQAALLEFRLGDAERGRSLFEGVLQAYPRRLDLWSVYLDQEVAQGDQRRVRALFERATHLELPPRKMKFLFKRALDYEKKHGDAAGVERVKERAMEFVQRAMAG